MYICIFIIYICIYIIYIYIHIAHQLRPSPALSPLAMADAVELGELYTHRYIYR